MARKWLRHAALLAGTAIGGAVATASAAGAEATPGEFEARLAAFIEKMRADASALPGTVVVVVHGDRTVFARAFGTRDAGSNLPMTLDSPVYNASTTKAYVGLLASQLDSQKRLPLNASLSDVWPDITLPAPHDPRGITVTRLLSHTSGIEDGGLLWRTNYSAAVKASEVPAHLAKFTTSNDPGFQYSNFGPYVYSAMVDTKLGLPFADAIERYVARPLHLTRTSARLEDFALREVAHCHRRDGGRWVPVPPKPTPVLNAGGGIYTTGNDAARFLKGFVGQLASSRGEIPQEVFDRTWQPIAAQNEDFWGFPRDGYGLGWDLGTWGGRRFAMRPGGYTGCRSNMIFFPAEKLGIAVLSVGEAGANAFNSEVIRQAVDLWTGTAKADALAEARIASYRRQAREDVAKADKPGAKVPIPPKVDPSRLAPFVGHYRSERLGDFEVSLRPNGLVAEMGLFRMRLIPAGKDLFQGYEGTDPEPAEVRFSRKTTGAITALVWDGRVFDRRP